MKRVLLKGIFVMLLLLPVLSEIPGKFYVNGGGQAASFFGSSVSDSGLDGENYFFNNENNIVVPVYKPRIGGGWFADGGLRFNSLPVYVEVQLGQTFHPGKWEDEENVLVEENLETLLIFSSLGICAGWELHEAKGFTQDIFLGGGFFGSFSGDAVYEGTDSLSGGFGGFYATLGGGSHYVLNEKFVVFTRLGYQIDFLNSANWEGDSGKLEPMCIEHEIILKLGVRYWLPSKKSEKSDITMGR